MLKKLSVWATVGLMALSLGACASPFAYGGGSMMGGGYGYGGRPRTITHEHPPGTPDQYRCDAATGERMPPGMMGNAWCTDNPPT